MKGFVKNAVWAIVCNVRNGETMESKALETIAKEYAWNEAEKQDFARVFPSIAVVLSVKGTAKNNDVRIVRTEKGESVCRKFVEHYASIIRENRFETVSQKDCKNHGAEKQERKASGFAGTVLKMREEDRKALADAIASGDSNKVAIALKIARENAKVA